MHIRRVAYFAYVPRTPGGLPIGRGAGFLPGIGGEKAQIDRTNDRLRAVWDTQLSVYVMHVDLDCPRSDSQVLRDLRVVPPLRHQPQYVKLSIRKQFG